MFKQLIVLGLKSGTIYRVDPARGYLHWTQKGPANGGKGRIFRAGLEIPAGQTAANRTDIDVLWNSLPGPRLCGASKRRCDDH